MLRPPPLSARAAASYAAAAASLSAPACLRHACARRATTILGLATLAVAGCARDRSAAERRTEWARQAHGDVVVGVAIPWSAYREVRIGEGVDLAVAEVNASGGVGGRRLRLIREDDGGTVEGGRLAAQRLVADPAVVAVIGHLQSFVSVPAAAIYDVGGVVMLSPTATDPELTEQGYSRVFRATFTERNVGRRMADLAITRGARHLGVFYMRDRYGRGVANAFEQRARELGADVLARESYNADNVEADLSAGGLATAAQTFIPTLRAWKKLGVDAVFVAGEVPSATPLLTAIRGSGLDAPIYGTEAMSVPPLLRAGPAAEGAVLASIFHPDEPRREVERFTAAFRAAYHAAPDAGAALGYDAVHLLADAMRRAHSTVPDDVASALHTTRAWPGVTGTFTFDSAGNVADKQFVQVVVRGGRFEYLPSAAPLAAVPPTLRGPRGRDATASPRAIPRGGLGTPPDSVEASRAVKHAGAA